MHCPFLCNRGNDKYPFHPYEGFSNATSYPSSKWKVTEPFIICFFYWFFQLRLPPLHSRYKAENSTLTYLGRSIHWQKEEANRNLLSIHLKITLLLLLLTPFDFLLLCLLCLCLLRHCSLCVTCDYT